uniref:chymotrypsin n=1 Tax=Labrus bergylta TaxID=56723 RepID=A0A3Q3MN96_9LABR
MELILVLLLVVPTVSGCGVPSAKPDISRVVNGEEARPYSWPWQISLESFFPTCGGTLIAPNWVLTAAHCITFHTYRVVLAEHDMDKEEGPEQFIMVSKMFIHPKWNGNCASCGNDIALLKLEKSAVINDKVQPACLPQHGATLTHNQPCYVTGWGRLLSGGPRAITLQQAILPVVDHSTCSQSDWWGSSAKTTMVCAGGESKSACHVRNNHTPCMLFLKQAFFFNTLLQYLTLFSGRFRRPSELSGQRWQVVRGRGYKFCGWTRL